MPVITEKCNYNAPDGTYCGRLVLEADGFGCIECKDCGDYEYYEGEE